jgi:hypothetical protein
MDVLLAGERQARACGKGGQDGWQQGWLPLPTQSKFGLHERRVVSLLGICSNMCSDAACAQVKKAKAESKEAKAGEDDPKLKQVPH